MPLIDLSTTNSFSQTPATTVATLTLIAEGTQADHSAVLLAAVMARATLVAHGETPFQQHMSAAKHITSRIIAGAAPLFMMDGVQK